MAKEQHSHHGLPASVKGENNIENKATPGISYFTPLQEPRAGTALGLKDGSSSDKLPKLFQPLKIRGLQLQNRIVLSPLCQYSAQNGHLTDWHLTHLGGIIQRGPGLAFVEATSVTANGRITPEDSGLWLDSQIEPLRRIVEFAHSQGQKIAIQLGHAGRKASTVAPWLSKGDVAGTDLHGWPDDVWAPSAVAYNDRHASPKAMTLDDIETLKTSFVSSVKRALEAGFDAIEIHNAHGYLLHEFLSPASNQRTDSYGGSFENRTRLTLELVDLTRKTIPQDMPLLLRISADDWLDHDAEVQGWTIDESVKLAHLLADRGVDWLDVSSAGLHERQKVTPGPGYQVPFAQKIKASVGDKLLVSAVGTITEGKQAEGYLHGKTGDGKQGDADQDKALDAVFVGRSFQKNPGLVWSWADELGVEGRWANQIRWGFGGRGK